MDNLRLLLEIKKYDNRIQTLNSDLIIREVSFQIFVNRKRLVTISALPSDLQYLGTGFLFSEGLVKSRAELTDYQIDLEEKYINFNLNIPAERIDNFHSTGEKTSGCGMSLSAGLDEEEQKQFPEITLEAEPTLELMKEFIQSSSLFRETGGVHIAALVENYKIKYFAEDIGRHNAVDKVIGMAVSDSVELSNSILYCSGRISSEIVKKAVRLHIPMIISKSAPTSEAIRLGWDYKVFIIGFARNQRMNIYTGFTDLEIK
ncbi:formate dehydrogenase accessory sulfurtransferase FdhD [Candidatus Cloacimonadota bacterium]